MKKWWLWPLFFFALNLNSVYPTSPLYLQLQWQIQEWLVNPHDVMVWKDKIFVMDFVAPKPILVFSTNGKLSGTLGNFGNGPGEIQNGAEMVGVFADRFLVVRDEQNRKFVFYDIPTLQFYQERKYTFSIISCELAGNKIFAIAIIPELYLGKILEINYENNNFTLTESGYWGNFDEIPEPKITQKNFLLKKAALCHDANGNVYLTIVHSSLLISFSNDAKLRFKTLKPFDIPIPEFFNTDKRFQAVAPPINNYATIYFDISTDESFLYAVYSGAKLQITSSADLQSMGKIFSKFYSSGKKILIFDKESGALKNTAEFPVAVWKLEVTRDAMYILSKEPAIALYKFLK